MKDESALKLIAWAVMFLLVVYAFDGYFAWFPLDPMASYEDGN